MIRLALADDHQLFREGLVALLRAEPDFEVVATASDAPSLYDAALVEKPDLALLDINMPGIDGFDLAETLAANLPATRIIFLTARYDPATVRRAMELSASIVLKDDAFEDLASAVRAVHAGGSFVSTSIGTVAPASKLSPRETEVLRLIAQGLQNKEIASQLGISLTTVRTHRARLMEKLDAHSGPELVRHALDLGLA